MSFIRTSLTYLFAFVMFMAGTNKVRESDGQKKAKPHSEDNYPKNQKPIPLTSPSLVRR